MSKKLAGNGLWESSRMMLPEHKEQLLAYRNDTAKHEASKVPTPEEILLVRDYCLLPMMLNVVETNLRSIEHSNYSLRRLYITSTQALLDLVHRDVVALREQLLRHHIRVFDEERVDNMIQFKFVCRGYEDHFTMTSDVARSEIGTRLTHYIRKLFNRP